MSETKLVPFSIARWDKVAVDEVLGKARGQTFAAALVYTPARCIIARIADGAFQVVDNNTPKPLKPGALAHAYEIRAFGENAELRWVRNGETGTATLIADGKSEPPGATEWTDGVALETLPRHYRVWGEPPKKENAGANSSAMDTDNALVGETSEAWSLLTAGRIGKLYVPCAAKPPSEIVLNAREYVVLDEKSGNAVVAFERLVGFDLARGETKTDKTETE